MLGSLVTVAESQTKPASAPKASSPGAFGGTKTKSSGTVTNPKCNGGWSGVVTLSKTLVDSLESDEPGIRKSIDRIQHKTSRNYDYNARAVVDASANPKQPIVNTKVTLTDNDLSWGLEKVFDTCNSRENGHWFTIEGTDDRQTQGRFEGPADSFNLSVDEMGGTYSFSLGFEKAQGIFKREEHVKKAGHCQAKNNEPYDRSTNQPTTIDAQSVSVNGEKIDPNSPDTLTGTKIWGDDGTGPVRSFIYKATWRFSRCPGKLIITDLKFEHPKFPNFEDWKEIQENKGTIDGNRVKVKVKVLNMGGEDKYADLKVMETYKGDKYNYARPDEPLPEAESSFRIDGGEEKEFEFIWDTEGRAWFDDSRPHLFHRIKAELKENGQKKDEKEKPLNIAPKPLVLLHGAWEDYRIWEPLYQNLLTESHSYNWKAFPVGEHARNGVLAMGGGVGYADDLYQNADQLAKYVKYAQTETNAWHVDMVAHQMGGLVARLYMHKLMPVVPDARPQVKHLVMLGTPNGGAKCVDVFAGTLGLLKDELKAARELTNENMINFNQYVVNTGGTKYSALAGNSVPVICGGFEWNDGFVTVKSAKYGVSDTGESNDLTHQLMDGKNFGNFVKPHLVTGPGKTYPLPVKNDPTDWKRWQVNNRDYDVNISSFRNGETSPENMFSLVSYDKKSLANFSSDNEVEQTFKGEAVIGAREVKEIEVPVEAAGNFGVTFFAHQSLTVSLVDDKGRIWRQDKAGSDMSMQKFRMLFFGRAVAKSTWKLRIQNMSDFEQKFAGFAWSLAEIPGMPGKQAVAE